jgi:hypothetical protein
MKGEYEYYMSNDNEYNVSVSRVDTDELEIYLESKTFLVEGVDLKAMKVIDKAIIQAYLQGVRTAKWQLKCALSEVNGKV